MADIFISYEAKDRGRVSPLVKEFERQGWSVWWDRTVRPGQTWARVISKALDDAKCVVVVWSKNSVDSDWVQEEAEEGRRRKILVPVVIDEVIIPLGYRRIQAARLADWTGRRRSHPEIKSLLDSIKRTLDPDAPPTPKPTKQKSESQEHKSESDGMPTDRVKELYKPVFSSGSGKPKKDG